MPRPARRLLAVLAGVAVWAALWNLATRAAQAAFPDLLAPGTPITHTGVLLAYIAGGAGLSVLAGFVAAAVAGDRPLPAVWALAIVQLGLGLIAEISYWSLMPAWYHVAYLALVVPATVLGGMLRAPRRGPLPASSPT